MVGVWVYLGRWGDSGSDHEHIEARAASHRYELLLLRPPTTGASAWAETSGIGMGTKETADGDAVA